MLANDFILDQMIESQRRARRYYLIFAGVIFSLGLVVIGTAYIIVGSILPEVFKHLIGLGGGFVSSLSSLQIEKILARKEREEMFVSLKVRLHEIKSSGETQDEDFNKRIDELFWKIFEKTATG